MAGSRLLVTVGLVGGFVWAGAPVAAQSPRVPLPIRQPGVLPVPAAFAPPETATGSLGSIGGVVRNEDGEPVAGVVVTAIGASTTFAVTDEKGRYELATLPPGVYLLRAHSAGHVAPKPRTIEVKGALRTPSSFSMRRTDAGPTVLAAGVGGGAPMPAPEPSLPQADGVADAQPADRLRDNHGETAWRMRHMRRGVLRDVALPVDLLEDDPAQTHAVAVMLGRAVSSPARAASSFFADTPWSGQVQLLTTNLFDSPEQLLSGASPAHGIAYVRVGAPAGEHADWTVRGALNDGDLSSWTVAGAYQSHAALRRVRDIGMSYSTQRYGGGNPLALREVSDGTRNAGSLYAFETFNVTPALTVTYGARYERYDYLVDRNLVSPRAEVVVKPFAGTRLSASVSSRADAPGAQEFRPPSDEGVWLPPQRTFSSAGPGILRAERSTQLTLTGERDWGPVTVALRAFRQRVDDQMATVFGADVPDFPGTRRGHYVIGTAGDVDANGGAIAMRASLGPRLRTSVAYTTAVAHMAAAPEVGYVLLLAPTAARSGFERLQDVTTTVQADVPETSTRVLVLYRVGTGYARPGDVEDPRLDSRFDIQVRQALPFLNFTSAKWEMLIALRNSFRDVVGEQSVYDELLTVQAPKRLVGGVTLHF